MSARVNHDARLLIVLGNVEQAQIQGYLGSRDRWDVTICVGWNGENTDEWVRDLRVLLEDNGIAWAFWPYKKRDRSSAQPGGGAEPYP